MDNEQPKSRIVVFRLTDHEYRSLKKASVRARRSLSDFTRAGVLSSLKGKSVGEPSGDIRQVEEELARVRVALQDLKELMLCKLSKISRHESGSC